jgi:propanol-preferring alcohol dehydrogenase
MRAMILRKVEAFSENSEPLRLVDLRVPEPAAGELLVRVSACGVCHTELDEIEGRLPPPRLTVVLGHEIVGRVVGTGAGVTGIEHGQRVGIGWIHRSTGALDGNLCPEFRATGRDIDGGYAEFLPIAAAVPIRPQIETYPLEAANTALAELKYGSVRGVKVLVIGEG